jgi:hypothetical protein
MENKEKLIVYHDCADDKDSSRKLSPREKKKFHQRNARITVVGAIDELNRIHVGIACCSGQEMCFDRKKGRELAMTRLQDSPRLLGALTEVQTEREARFRAIKSIKKFAHELRRKVIQKNGTCVGHIVFSEEVPTHNNQ